LATPASLDRLGLALLDGLPEGRAALPGRGLLTPPPRATDRLILSDAMLHHVAALPDGTAALRWSGGSLPLDGNALGWLERLAEGVSAAELGEAALDFCRSLAAAGLLVRQSP